MSLVIGLGTLRSEDEDDYEYEFHVLSTRTSKNVVLQTLCACSVRKTRTRSGPRPPAYFHNNRPFPHSSKQWHRVEVAVDKNTVNVRKCPPQPRSGAIVRTHWSGMRERSIRLFFEASFCAHLFICKINFHLRENEFNLRVNENWLAYERMGIKTRFEKETWGTWK